MSSQPKTKEQMGRIFGLARKLGLEFSDDEVRRSYAVTVSSGRVDKMSELSFDEANALIKNLGGDPLGPQASRLPSPRRTVNYHRQKAGVQQIAQQGHLEKMYELAEARHMTAEGLQNMGNRMLKHWPPRTTKETNKIIEALKAMNARDRVSRPHVSKGSTQQEAA